MKPNLKERLQNLKMVAGGWRPQAIDLGALKTLPAGRKPTTSCMCERTRPAGLQPGPKPLPAAGVAPGAEVERELSLEF